MKIELELTKGELNYIVSCLQFAKGEMLSLPSKNFIQGILDKLEEAYNASLRSSKM